MDIIDMKRMSGAPPRAWGGRRQRRQDLPERRSTPTGVGRTKTLTAGGEGGAEHPHGRGEDPLHWRVEWTVNGAPPRAWGGPGHIGDPSGCQRSTPTGVGRTAVAMAFAGAPPEHPHGRGEDTSRTSFAYHASGAPPRAWGGPTGAVRQPLTERSTPRAWGGPTALAGMTRRRRSTPTGVGRTPRIRGAAFVLQEHPHGRGEDGNRWSHAVAGFGAPPRAWGGRRDEVHVDPGPRSTPTGVGRTIGAIPLPLSQTEHPHGRGEDRSSSAAARSRSGAPPRAWGGPSAAGSGRAEMRSTPTGVGRTAAVSPSRRIPAEHPHGRGEDVDPAQLHRVDRGAPPRAWGGPVV